MRLAALVFAFFAAGLGSLFAAGEALSDPGGAAGAVLVAAWAVPLSALSLLAWLRPERSLAVVGALLVVLGPVMLWAAVDPGTWRSLEDSRGPVRAVAALVLILPLALAGRRRPAVAGALLLLLGLTPVIAGAVARGGVAPSTLVVATAAIVDGILYLAAGAP